MSADVPGYSVRRVATDAASLADSAAILRAAFPAARYDVDMLRWQYAQNPDGTIVGFEAVAPDGSGAAHYVAQPLQARIDGRLERGLLSFNTATHPAHQGKGLFTLLGSRTYEAAANEGYGFVVGVANANSTPGFTRKLGFQLVTPLDARLIAPVPPPSPGTAVFARAWTRESALWRAQRPYRAYRWSGEGLYAATDMPLVRALITDDPLFTQTRSDALGFRPVTLFIGRDPGGKARGLAIPDRLKPSPLNLIFLDLRGRRTLDAAGVRFRVADFDAY